MRRDLTTRSGLLKFLVKANRKMYAFYFMLILLMTLSDP